MRLRIKIIDLYRGTEILVKYDQLIQLLKNSQDHEVLRRQNLKNLLITLKNSNNYYKSILCNDSDNEIATNPEKVLLTLPYIDKKIINEHYDQIYTPISGRPDQRKKTGGSTGEPFYYFVDKEHLSWMWAHNYLFWNLYSGYNPGDPFITIAGNSLRAVNRQFSESLYHGLQNNYFIKGDLIKPDLKLNIRKLNKANLIYGYPSSIENILKLKPDFPSHFKNLKAIFTTSEQLLPSVRMRIESAFGKPVYDIYGANDGGILGCECNKHDGYHYNSLNCYAETMNNESGLPEVVLTNLSSLNFPFVRYRVGDIGSIDNKTCSCGISWPKITDLKGRTRDLIKTPDGKAIHGSFFNNIFYKFHQIDGYRIVQEKDYTLNVFIHVKNHADFNGLSAKITGILHSEVPELKVEVKNLEERNPTNSKFKLIESHVN
ncbi:MAG: phenylacetate--CoA ligase family protein [Bacteroidales bacterium]|nr:phenylacetate--CoA ligase family protein [Bacteroidales bacterium]